MVQSIEQYDDVLKVILKPTKSFPEGSNYFYTDASARELVEMRGWCLAKRLNSVYPVAKFNGIQLEFHKAYANFLGVEAQVIDHINTVCIDNRDVNMNVVTTKENSINRRFKSYCKVRQYFRVHTVIDDVRKSRGYFKNEFEVIKAVYEIRKKYYADYDYNFLLDRSGDLDILDDELTGRITSEEATFRHVMRYAKDNAWYVYRYGLEEYFNSRGIKIPTFELDYQGYMIDTITKERLCPFK